ncbi:MAG: aminotransferase class I/II-fold pyridoxal phosphate-dependent enzyme, partial [Actinobacteria bacterium]|nr:aminotransferase class I/II-fold pyridoxal phosphate-dependent enzyme [Actinomycetota bacterium]
AGILDFRREVAKYISKTRKVDVLMDEVVITSGVKPMLFYVLNALIDHGDEVIYPNPGYPIYESIINFIGGKAVPLPLLEEKNFSFDVNDLKKAITEKTKMIIINSPQNPTGGILTKKDLNNIAELAKKYNLWVISDEIYSRIVYDGEFESIISIPGMKERTILCDGFSKIYAMTGWRLGYGVMIKELAEQVIKLNTNVDTCSATFTQYAGIEAYRGSQNITLQMVNEFKERRDLIFTLLNDIKGFRCLKPQGAFYIFPNVTDACRNLGLKNSDEIQQYILHKADVAVLPRTSFGVKNAGEKDEYIRFSYAASKEEIRKGLERIKRVIER